MLVGHKETCKVTDFGMARDVQQENIYERKTKVFKKEGRWGRYYISFSLVIFHNHCTPDFDDKILGRDRNENISLAYTSIILNITVFDRSLPIIF